MGSFSHKYNTDNVFSRAVIVGLVNTLNNKIQFINTLSDDEVDVIEVPWIYNQAGSERFMQDYFTHWNDCVHPKMADGNYDVIPRGNIILNGETINSSALTNRFVRGKRVKEVDGQLQTFNSYLNSIPLVFSFECEIKTDTYLDALKIQQTIREVFYATQIYYTSYDGFRIPCQVGFPTDYGLEKTFEYAYGDNGEVTITFSLELETYQPVLDKTSEKHNANRITAFSPTINPGMDPGVFSNKEINLTSPQDLSPDPETYYSGAIMPIEWDTKGSILRVNLFYLVNNTGDWIPIKKIMVNNGSYMWDVPYLQEESIYYVLSQDSIDTAVLRPLIDTNGSVYDIIIYHGGSGYTNELTISIEEKGFSGNLAEVVPIIESGEIIGFDIIDGGSGYTISEQFTLSLKIEDSNNQNILNEVNNILIK